MRGLFIAAAAAVLALVAAPAAAVQRFTPREGEASSSGSSSSSDEPVQWVGSESYDEPLNYATEATSDDMNYREHPLLLLIQRYESGGRYDVLYGGGRFEGYADHPWGDLYEWRGGSVKRVDSPRWSQVPVIVSGANKGDRSTAAGRYQIMSRTWVQNRDSFGLPDFAPDSQDKFAFLLLRQAGALRDYERGDLAGAIRKAARLWTSLPTSTTGESQLSMSQAINELKELAS